MRIESLLLILLPLWGFAQTSLLSLGDYQVGLGDRGVEILWRGHNVITGSYLRIARPNYQGADYLYFRSGEAKVEGNGLEVKIAGENGKIEGIYTVKLQDKGVLIDLALKLNDPSLPAGPREYAVGIFPPGLVDGAEYEVELPLGKGEGRIPKETEERAADYGPAFRWARLKTNEGFDVIIQSLSGSPLSFHDARGSDWFSQEDRRLWIWAPRVPLGDGVFLNTTVLISCQERKETKRKGEVVIVDDGKEVPVKGIVVPSDSPIEKSAGKELAHYIEKMIGKKLTILEEGSGKGFIFIGKKFLPEGEFEGFRDDGFLIRQKDGNLYIAGKGYRGTIFAVYRFLELMGCRFLAREEEKIPQVGKLKVNLKEVRENPAFEWRYFDTTIERLKCYLDPGIRDEEIQGEKVPAVLGAPFFWHHPMNGYLPLSKFRDTHPEYYCLIDGKRWPIIKRYSGWEEQVLFHPCVSNPEVRKVILDTLLPLMDSHPDARYFTVHAGDSDYWCQCDRCLAMDVDPNNKADRMVQFTNAIGEVVAKYHPDKFVTMLAYVKAYHPPLKFSPRENVLVWFCPIGACQIHPWRAPCNKTNYDVLIGWIQKHPSGGMGILTFDYPMNYIYYIAPFPAMFAYLENLKLYERLHIRGLYICGIPSRMHLAHLFSYIVPRMMWNPKANADEYVNDFLQNWFGPAAPQMKEYLPLLRELVESGKSDFNPWQMPPKELFTPEFLEKVYKLFDEGEKACKGQEIYLHRLWKEKAGILYTDLLLYGVSPQLKETDMGLQLVQPSPDQLKKLAELLKICLLFGWDSLQEGLPLLDWVSGLLGYSPKASGWFSWWEDPIMKQFIDDPIGTFERSIKPKLGMRSILLENDALRVEVIPSLGGRIRSIFFKKENIELLWQPPIPVVYSGTRWRDFGGYEEFIGEELGAPGWKEKYKAEVAPDGQSLILTCSFPNGLVLTRRISLVSSPVGIRISSTLKNEGTEVLKGVILRTHPELIFAMDAGPVFISRDLKGEWRNIELKEQENFLDRELFAGGIIAVVDYKRAKGFIHQFYPEQIERCMIYKGKDFYNLELFSPKKDLAAGEEIKIDQGFYLPEVPASFASFGKEELKKMEGNRWVHPLAEPLPIEKNGPFLRLKDGRLATVDSRGISFSEDEGVSWSQPLFICEGINDKEPASYDLVQTDDGTIVLLYLNFKDYRFSWDEEKCEPLDCKLELWSVRSLDGGKTWVDNQRVVEGYNTNFFGFIKTSKGRLVAGVDHFVSNPGRSTVMSVYSDDGGKSWKRSNLIDLGGRGHHDGAMEPTIAELSDGRLLMLIRTNLDRFWRAISDDGGRYWRRIEPSSIDASSSPGRLLRLKSGRLVLVWNRLNPEGKVYPKSGPWAGGEVPASWHREELSISFSEDDGESWTPPIVIARQKGGQLSYPYLYEAKPGELWVIAGFAFQNGWQNPLPLRLKLNEETFLKESQSKMKN